MAGLLHTGRGIVPTGAAVIPLEILQQRFESLIYRSDLTDCWIWTGPRDRKGYGSFWIGGKKRHVRASWFLLPAWPIRGYEACHHCDNPCCVNPNHIFIGTRHENVMDSEQKGRRWHGSRDYMIKLLSFRKPPAKGEAHPNHKYTNDQIIQIKRCPHTPGALTALAKRLGIPQPMASQIRSGIKWKHLNNYIPHENHNSNDDSRCSTD